MALVCMTSYAVLWVVCGKVAALVVELLIIWLGWVFILVLHPSYADVTWPSWWILLAELANVGCPV